jgi:hypothetical protein
MIPQQNTQFGYFRQRQLAKTQRFRPWCLVKVRLQMCCSHNFGQAATKAISKAIAKKLYSELHIGFADYPHFNLGRYIDEAKRIALKLRQQESDLENEILFHI